MDNEKEELQAYIQGIQDRISVAVALAVIRSKPKSVTTADYVSELQQRVLKEWHKSSSPDVFQDKLVTLQLSKVAQEVAEVLPDEPTVLFDDSPIGPTSSAQLEASLPPFRSPSPKQDDEVVDRHGTFFRSLVQLKFAVDSRKTIPFGQVRKYLRDMQGLNGSLISSPSNRCGDRCQKKSQNSGDSGVSISGGNAPKAPDSVSSSLFRSITHSAKMEVLITKTTDSLVGYIHSAVFNHPFDSYYRWKGSLLEKTCDTLASSLADPVCQSIVIAFLEESLDQIWLLDDILKSFSLEHQLKILSRLCTSGKVCSYIVNNVLAKFEEFADSSSQMKPPSPSNIHQVEKLPHFLHFAEILFRRWKSTVVKNTDCNISVSSVNSNVWHLNQDNEVLSFENQHLLNVWRDILEKLSVSCIDFHLLVNAHLLSALASIDALIDLNAPKDGKLFDTTDGDLNEY